MRAKFVSENLNVLLGGVLLLVLAVTAVFAECLSHLQNIIQTDFLLLSLSG